MKKFLVMAVSLAIVSAGIIACKKDNQPQVGPQQGNPQISKYTVKAEQVPNAIGSFLKSYALNQQRDGDPQFNMELGEALWNLEAAVNYHFRSEKDLIEQRATYTHEFDLPIVVNGNQYEATAADINTAYTNAIDFVNQALATNNEDEKVLVADFSIVSNTDNIAKFKIEILSYIEVGRGVPWELDDTDYWFPVGINIGGEIQGGKCGDYLGEQIAWLAHDRWNQIINYNLNVGRPFYYTDITSIEGVGGNVDENGDPCFGTFGYGQCLSPEEMQYWLDQALYALGECPLPDPQYLVISAELTLGFKRAFPDKFTHYFESIFYGIPYLGDEVEL